MVVIEQELKKLRRPNGGYVYICEIMDNEFISLEPIPSKLLSYLLTNKGKVVTIDACITHLWGAQYIYGRRNKLRVNLTKIRKFLIGCGVGLEIVRIGNDEVYIK
jgi:DNA-binding response OmpR family regulator